MALGLGSRFERVNLAVTTVAVRTGRPPTEALITTARERPPAFALAQAGERGGMLSPSAYFGASMSILYPVLHGRVRGPFAARRTAGRHLAGCSPTPISPGQVIAGKTLSVSVLGLGWPASRPCGR